MILGRTGDIAKCEDGHPLYKLLSDVVSGQVMKSAAFEPIGDASKPQYAKQVENCHICGKPWIKQAPNGWLLCNLERKSES
jgi:hypothetical protein